MIQWHSLLVKQLGGPKILTKYISPKKTYAGLYSEGYVGSIIFHYYLADKYFLSGFDRIFLLQITDKIFFSFCF